MKHRPDTPEGVAEMRMIAVGEHVYWHRESPQLERNIHIYPQVLTAPQLERLNEIERELIDMAYDASEETRTRTVLKGK